MNKPAKHRYQVLDSLRGICACMVILFHFHTVGWISNLALVRDSWLFVDFFFVLSGFVIATAYRRRLADGFSIAAFMGLRLGRIYPMHLFVLGLFLAVQLALLAKGGSGAAFQGHMTIRELLASLTLTQTFVLPIGVVWNGPSWSIAVEMWTYLVFAVIFRLFGSALSLTVVCAIVVLLSCAYIAIVHGGNMDAFHFGAFFRCTYGFALGVIGAVYYPQIRGKWASAATALELAAAGLVILVIATVGNGPFSMVAPPLFLALILVFASEGGLVSAGLKTRLPLLLGELSYSIYMVHLFIVYRLTGMIGSLYKFSPHPYLICETNLTCSATGSPLVADALIVPLLAVVIGVAWLTRHYIELPCENWAKAALLRRQQRVAAPDPAPHAP
jgi:peptidoglycan/LPS O-acetylase OafA/YrhL